MPTEPRITPTNLKVWTNRHETVKQQIDNLFDISNGDTGNVVNDYNATTTALQGMIAKAIVANKKLRVLGAGWSFSPVAATDGWMLNTKHLNMLFTISSGSIATTFSGDSSQLLFAQCGNSMQELNTFLKNNNKSLKTSGASNGQTIIGAISTGTHGSAFDFGATQDFIVGLHVIVSPDRHIWLERASYPVVSDSFIQRLQTELIRDDDLFNSVLVSFGSFGFIHGAMIETEPIYLLEAYRKRITLDDRLKHTMQTLDFSNVPLPHGSERPFHFQAVVNQYDLAGGAYVTVMYKRPYTPDYQPPVYDADKAGPGDDVPSFIGKLTDFLPGATPFIVNQLFKRSYPLYDKALGTLGEIFTSNFNRGKALSAAMGMPITYVGEINDLLIQLNNTYGPFSGVFSYRYVKKSKALLAFTQYEDTCVVELDGLYSAHTFRFYEAVWNELDQRNIPYTFHWGKVNNLNAAKIEHMYSLNRAQWLLARNALLPDASINIFNTQTLINWGLDRIGLV